LNCLITDEIFDDIAQHTSQYILTIHHNFSRESDAKLANKTGTKTFIELLCLAGALRSSTRILEELWDTDGDGIKKFRVVMNQNRFRFIIKCSLE
jgi:hypothetical protein